MDLPPSWQEQQQTLISSSSGTLDSFVSKDKFSVDLLNVVCVIWVVRHALPWARFQDVGLRAAFRMSNVSATLRSPVWAANTAKRLYCGMQNTVLQMIKVSFFFIISYSFRMLFLSIPLLIITMLFLSDQ
jgi:hypothetical protein